MRVLITEDPFIGHQTREAWEKDGEWPASWICCADSGSPPFVTAYRLTFLLQKSETIRVHVSADERYELFLDGLRIGRGSERGDPDNWFYETYDLPINSGEHCLVARVWSLGALSPIAQMHVQDGFLLCAEKEFGSLLSTGIALWEAERLPGYQFITPFPFYATGAMLSIDGKLFPWGFEHGNGDGWASAHALGPAFSRISPFDKPETRYMKPAMLPPMVEQRVLTGSVRSTSEIDTLEVQGIPIAEGDKLNLYQTWDELIKKDQPITIPAHSFYRIIIDLEDYYCAYPEIITTGGAASLVRISWAESHLNEPGYIKPKGNRNQIDGKYFCGRGDTFIPDGGEHRTFGILWWEAGRYIEVVVQTSDQPLKIERFVLMETRYPMEMDSSFSSSDPRLETVIPILVRGIQMDSHETFMDCPYYEQLMYAGDTRLEILTSFMMTRDDRLPQKALRMFDSSRRPSGITQSRYPNRLFQVIPPFTLWWVTTVSDFALWRGNIPFLKKLMPGVHASLEGYNRFLGNDGLLHAPEGWNFMDWVPSWEGGVPPDGALGISGLLNWQYVLTLTLAAQLESMLGEKEFASLTYRQGSELASKVSAAFWDETKGMFADDLSHRHYSEHTQCLAVLSGYLDPARRPRIASALINSPDLARTTVYFSHYLFEAYRELGLVDALWNRMDLWFNLIKNGFKTPVEQPEPSRSDCHAWGSHPLFHYFSTILGIRPASLGFQTVQIAPQLGSLTHAKGCLVHPAGEISVDFQISGSTLRSEIELPDGITGQFVYQGTPHELHEGKQIIVS
jgi:alpha-L-rhamnosidase